MIDKQVQEFLAVHNQQPTYDQETQHEEDLYTAP